MFEAENTIRSIVNAKNKITKSYAMEDYLKLCHINSAPQATRSSAFMLRNTDAINKDLDELTDKVGKKYWKKAHLHLLMQDGFEE